MTDPPPGLRRTHCPSLHCPPSTGCLDSAHCRGAPDDFDPATSFAQLDGVSPRYEEWQRLMDNFQERVPEAQADEHWAFMERVFALSLKDLGKS